MILRVCTYQKREIKVHPDHVAQLLINPEERPDRLERVVDNSDITTVMCIDCGKIFKDKK